MFLLRLPRLRRRRTHRRRRRSSRFSVGDGELEPVLLVSGMGGTILNAKKKSNPKYSDRAWVRIFLANLQFQKYLWSMYNPETGCVEQLDTDIEIVVPDDDYGLYAIDILDPSWIVKILRLNAVYHFHDMIEMLVDCGYTKGSTLFGFGYDFRQSTRLDKLMNGLKVKFETAYKASGGKKVNIISHSMGGLLVRNFMSLYNDIFAKYVNKWICLTCPFQGAPGCINDSMLTGLQFLYGFENYFFVSRWTTHQLLVECPSIYEMLPSPHFNWREPPLVHIWTKNSKGGNQKVEYNATDCISLFEEALKDNVLSFNGKTYSVPFNKSVYKWSCETREILDKAKLPDSVSFYNIYGASMDTPYHVCYGTKSSPIEQLSEVCHTMPQYSYVGGDGTVPAESAMADGFDAVERVGLNVEHRGVLSDDTVFKYVKKWLGLSEIPQKRRSRISRVMDVAAVPTL